MITPPPMFHGLLALSPVAGPAADAGHAAPAQPLGLALLIMLAAAAAAAMALRYLRIGPIPAYLVTGVLVGPMLGLIQPGANVDNINSLAMILLMFTIGMHLDPSGIRGGMIQVMAVGVVSTLLFAAVCTPVNLAAGLGLPSAIAVAMALSMSSTAVVLQLLQQRREMHRLRGRLCVGISIVQDLLSLGFLASFPLLAAWEGTAAGGAGGGHGASFLPDAWPAAVKAVLGLAGIAALFFLGRRFLPLALHEAEKGRSADVPLVFAAAAALGAAVVAAGLGFSPELGAFLAGFLLAATPFRHQLSGQLAPMRDLFMAVFFTSVGLRLNVGELVSGWSMILIGLVGVIALKAAIIGITIWAFGGTATASAKAGFSLAQAGEFTIVLLSAAHGFGLATDEALAHITAIVVASLALTPALFGLGDRVADRVQHLPIAGWSRAGALREAPPEPPADEALTNTPTTTPAASATADGTADAPAGPKDDALEQAMATDEDSPPRPQPATPREPPKPRLAKYVIIAGFGVVGRSLADRLELAGVPFCVIDLNRQTIETQRRLGRLAVYGDTANPEVLESAGLHKADAVLLTIPDDEATLRACRTVRALSPTVFIAARTSFLSKAMIAAQLGADEVVVEEVATAETMARQVLARLARRAAEPGAGR